MVPAPDSRRIERLGEYVVHRVIGEGGMGIVYEATERLSGRRVALKVLHSSLTKNTGARDRFFGEMRVMAGLEHPNIVRSLSSAEIEGKLVMVLEYLEGRTLREELEHRGRLPPSLTITVASAIASALGAAHGASSPVVHRDLKPENVMLAADGRIKVMDFGIAKVLGETETHTTQAVGTLRYMSPEQAGGGVISPQTDLYALGLLVYEMLTGQPPFEATSLLGILRHHSETPPPPLPDDVRREIPHALEELTFQLLEKDPRARPKGALEVLNALIALSGPLPSTAVSGVGAAATPPHVRDRASTGGGPAPPRRDDTIALIMRLEKKRRWPYVVGFAVLAVAACGVGGWLLTTQLASPSRRSVDRGPAPERGKLSAALAERCVRPQDRCVEFHPPDPTAVPAEAIIAESDKLARQLNPQAMLVSATFMDALTNGAIDYSRKRGNITMMYATPQGSILVMLSPDGFVGMPMASSTQNGPLAPTNCPLKRAFEVAFGPGFSNGGGAYGTLSVNPVLGVPAWTLSTGSDSALVNAATCTLHTNRGR